MPGFTGFGPAIVTLVAVIMVITVICVIAVLTRDPARRAAALEVLRMLLRSRPAGDPARERGQDTKAVKRAGRRRPPRRNDQGRHRRTRPGKRNRGRRNRGTEPESTAS